jgi:hypothetical protein
MIDALREWLRRLVQRASAWLQVALARIKSWYE